MTRKAAVSTFVPAVSFTGYPDGETPVYFKAGARSAPVPVTFINLMERKGLVAEEPASQQEKDPQ